MKLDAQLNEAYADYYAKELIYLKNEMPIQLANWVEEKNLSGLVIHFLKWAFFNKHDDLVLTRENLVMHKKWLKRMLKMGYSINDAAALPF